MWLLIIEIYDMSRGGLRMNCYQRLGWARPYTTSFDQGLQFKELELILVQLESEPTSVKDPSREAIQAMLALRSNWTQEAKRKYEKLYIDLKAMLREHYVS
ncbi:hypothetical protein EM59_019265 [Vibrio parahaemolyticus]|nr:hypothetical protein UF29_23335 [Vibrio parahaemolyticus]OQU34410.1 hypothetical protein EM59_019265 [Vibrio parahaemolyticus]